MLASGRNLAQCPQVTPQTALDYGLVPWRSGPAFPLPALSTCRPRCFTSACPTQLPFIEGRVALYSP